MQAEVTDAASKTHLNPWRMALKRNIQGKPIHAEVRCFAGKRPDEVKAIYQSCNRQGMIATPIARPPLSEMPQSGAHEMKRYCFPVNAPEHQRRLLSPDFQ